MTKTTDVMNALKKVMDPELGRSVVDLNMVRDLSVNEGTVAFTLALTIPGMSFAGSTAARCPYGCPGFARRARSTGDARGDDGRGTPRRSGNDE